MGLTEYKKKRDFYKTPEPEAKRRKMGETLRFVIQRHEARRLHYDLRLEMEGVLKSWAVPKGPSLNPQDKRLAVMTEDHPVDYLQFHGVIPKGNYGAGRMTIWDQGTYHGSEGASESEIIKALKKGHLKLTFQGEKIQGSFSLVQIKGDEKNQWLLIKSKDKYAVDVPYDSENHLSNFNTTGTDVTKKGKAVKLNHFIQPMLAKKTDKPFDNPDWIYELKWDGYRAIASNLDDKIQLYSRNGISFMEKFRPVANSLNALQHDVVLDGEIVLLDQDGKPHFQELQNYNENSKEELRYYVFDILHLNGHDLYQLPLTDRKNLIEEAIAGVPHLMYCDHVSGMGTAFFNRTIQMGIEGMIAKKADSRYFPGIRTDSWLKVKGKDSQEAVICGFTESTSSRKYFGSLILGVYEEGDLRYAGNCGSGFDESMLKEVYDLLAPLKTEESPFEDKINLKGRKPNWVKPRIICEVVFSEWTKTGHMRHPVFKGIRSDKSQDEITVEENIHVAGNSPAKGGRDSLEVDGIAVHFSNLNKVYWPDEGFTKYDLIEYYLGVSEYILPYLKDRPQNLLRHPEGIKKEGFFHKDTGDIMPEWMESVTLYSESADREINYTLCQNTASLLHLANLGCIELNPWHTRTKDLTHPDYTIIDLDPGEKTTFEDAIEVAQATKEVLDLGGIEAYCKTSGSRGLHIYIPLGARYDYEQARDFVRLICYMVHEMLPKLTSMNRDPRSRKDKVYLDFLQNRRGQTLAAPYCVRPKPGATVSTPLLWEEVKAGLKKEDFHIKNTLNRLEGVGDLFQGILGEGIDMEKCLERLEGE